MTQADTTTDAYSGSFGRDTLTWAFARLAERTLDHLFSQPSSRARYARWLLEEAPQLALSAGPEQGLFLTDFELGEDGHYSLVARPPKGEFILVAQHRQFHVVMASYYGVFTPTPEQECVCIAHFEGNPQLAARWATGLRHWLDRQWRTYGTATLDAAAWAQATPAKC
jgi:hypothetical protein